MVRPRERRTVPERLRKTAFDDFVDLPAPLVLGPALVQFPLLKPHHSPLHVSVGGVGLEAQGFLIAGERFVQLLLLLKHRAQGAVGVGQSGLERQRLLKAVGGLRKLKVFAE